MNKKKLLAMLLSLTMLGSIIGIPVYADNTDADTGTEQYEATDAVPVEELTEEPAEELTEEQVETEIYEEAESVLEDANVQLFSDNDVSLMATNLTGAGTSNSPYLIYSESDLLELSVSTDTTFLSAYFQLQNDITITTDNWSPIGINTSTPFKGTFDGNGYTINNVSIPENSYSYAGLFGVVTGTIKNLGVSSDIAGGSTAGALAGYVNGGTIEYCYSSGAVSSTSGYTGGLLGFIQNANIHDSYSVATVTNTNSGGNTGGLVGRMYYRYGVCTIKDCYAAGTVTSTSSNSGGIVGYKDTYGDGNNNILGCYYSSSTTKQTDTGRGFSITSAKMKVQDTFTAWDFDYVWEMDSSINSGYPYLNYKGNKPQIVLSGNGSERSPYIITNETELLALARGELTDNYTSYYQLASDITVNSDYWTPIGGNARDSFSGTFDGNGHIISGIKLSQAAFEYSGLFGVVTGTVKNLGVDVKISGSGTSGALAGYVNGGTVEYCYSSGAVSSTSGYTGGLLGFIQNANIHDSYSVATVTNTNSGGNTGGLVGRMYYRYGVCTIKDCYAAGTVTSTSSNSGGIVGYKDTYGDGNNNILGCYYNSSTTKQTDTGRGFSVTTAKIKSQNTFTAWDFDYVWKMDGSLNSGYPYLQTPISKTNEDIELEGSGNEVDPYIITNERELLALTRGELRNNYTSYYQLANDITVNSDYWTPIGGNGRDSFSGTFDGNGHIISGIKLSQAAFEYSGLFGVVTGTVKNLGVDVKISGTGTAGALAGYVNGGTVEYCYSSGAVSSTSGYTGGLLGFIQNANIHDSYSVATVTNTNSGGNTGGLVGRMYYRYGVCTIKDCYAAGTVTSTSSNSGGIVGYKDTYGDGNNNILGCYYNSSTTKQTDAGKGFSVSTDEMTDVNTFTAWDFDYVWEINGSTNCGYPYLQLPITETREDIELDGSGNEVDPYIITNETELLALARGELRNNYTSYYQLANDITVNSDYWTPIGGNGRDSFSGTFDGNGHIISDIKLSQAAFEYSGLFGVVTGTVKNLGVDVKISGSGTAGALAGYVNDGTIEYCYSSGAVSSTSGYTGGLLGFIQNANIHDSYSVATVTNTNSGGNTGGLVGRMYYRYDVCEIQNCYATGEITSTSNNAGGIVGYKDTYGSGSNNIISCYYDNYDSTTTDKGTAVSTEAMKTQSTFTDWDFNTIWALSETKNNGYPYLQNVSTEIQVVKVTGITLNKTTLSVEAGKTGSITANVTPTNATNKKVTWISSDANIAVVSNGNVTGISEGTAIITAITSDGGYTASCTVTVTPSSDSATDPIAVTSITLDKTTLSVAAGRTATITANIAPANATNKNVTWTSSNPSVATVVDGKVTGVSEGTTVIIALTADGNFTAACSVTVTAPVVVNYPYEITNISLETESGAVLTTAPVGRSFIVNAELIEKQERAKKDYLFIAVYGTDGALLSMNYMKSDFVTNQIYNLGLNIQAQSKPIGTIKAFVWSGFDGMEPLAEIKEL